MADDAAPFPYMRWAKAHLPQGDPHSLGLSGLPRPAAGALAGILDPFLAGGADPRPAWKEALARHHGTAPECVHPALGTSHANFLVYLAFARGGHVAAETPAYEALHRLAPAVGATLSTFARRPETRWRVDPDELAAAAVEGTRLLAVTDLHNPSGARLDDSDLALLVEAAERLDAVVLVDEVYLDLDPQDRPSAATGHPRVVATSSLTKSHGLWDLRAGWVLGDPDRIAAVERWDDLVCPSQPPITARQALAYLPQAGACLEATRARSARRTEQVDRWVRGRGDVWWTRPDGGFTGFLRIGRPGRPLDGDAVARDLAAQAGVHIVPGSFFQRPAWLRISYMLEEADLDAALAALGEALDRARS